MEETPIGQEDLLIVEMPAELFDGRIFENLDRILENKGTLIKHALQTPHLHYEVVGDKVRFPWFTVQQDGDADAYCQSFLHCTPWQEIRSASTTAPTPATMKSTLSDAF